MLEILFCQKPAGRSVLLFVDNSRYLNDSHYVFGKMFVARITLSRVTEQMTSNSVSAQIFLTLWTLNPGAASSCSTVWMHAVWKHNILQFIY